MSWLDCNVAVDLNRPAVKDAPPYAAVGSLKRGQEMGIYEHDGRTAYRAVQGERGAA